MDFFPTVFAALDFVPMYLFFFFVKCLLQSDIFVVFFFSLNFIYLFWTHQQHSINGNMFLNKTDLRINIFEMFLQFFFILVLITQHRPDDVHIDSYGYINPHEMCVSKANFNQTSICNNRQILSNWLQNPNVRMR